MKAKKRKSSRQTALPTREDILAFIAEHPGKSGKREIARHFDLRGADKIGLKTLLKDLEAEGVIERRGKGLNAAGRLPNVGVLLIVERDIDGDLIAVPIEWDEEAYGPAPKVLITSTTKSRGSGPQAGLHDRVLARISAVSFAGDLTSDEDDEGPGEDEDPGEDQAAGAEEGTFPYTAIVMRVLDKRRTRVLGVLRYDGNRFYLAPIDRKQRELPIDQETIGDAETGDLVAVEPISSGRFGPTRAKLTERIGSMKSEHAISTIALLDHDIPYIFPEAVLNEADAAPEASSMGREDWRDIPFITIDPADAKDHDDAVFAEQDTDPDNAGGYVVYVAIADVAAYVTPGSALDREAQKRGNSVYFPDRVVPMLPERISNNLCSLREGEVRPSMAVKMVFDQEGAKRSHSFHRILMRSSAKLSYQDAQAAIDHGASDAVSKPLLSQVLEPIYAAYACLLKGRDRRKPLELDLPEKKIILNPDGTVQSVFVPPRLDSHKLIEEFMIQANVAAAEMLEKIKKPVVYRIHDAPSREKLSSLKDFLSTLNLKGPGVGAIKPERFNTLIAKVAGTEHAELVNEVILRSQAQAEYNCDNIGHFGLNLRRYAHFTSPIRRYADLLVHRSLIAGLGLGEDGLPRAHEAQLMQIASEITVTERRAMAAERDTIDRLIGHFLADQVGAKFVGKITGVVKSGLFVRLHDSAADGYIPAATLGQDYYVFDEVGRCLVGERTGEAYRLGDQVDVKLVEAEPLAGSLRFEMISPGTKGKPLRRNSRPQKRQAPRRTSRRR